MNQRRGEVDVEDGGEEHEVHEQPHGDVQQHAGAASRQRGGGRARSGKAFLQASMFPTYLVTRAACTEQLHFPFSRSCFGEGNGRPLPCSCLEKPRDAGAWRAAVYGVTESDATEVT